MILIKSFSPVVQKKNDVHQSIFTVYTYYYAIHTTMFCIVLMNPLSLYRQSKQTI
jgi:hypothetical protein